MKSSLKRIVLGLAVLVLCAGPALAANEGPNWRYVEGGYLNVDTDDLSGSGDNYFLGDRDPRYVDLIELEEPFPYNKGPKRGALVEARLGKGRWIYVGLGLWRQLPAGTDGAYQLLANLISLGKAP